MFNFIWTPSPLLFKPSPHHTLSICLDATFDGPPLSANVCLSPKSLLRLVIDHDDLHKRKQLYKTYSSSSEHIDVTNQDHDLDEEFNHFVNYVRLTPVTFMKLCPALLAQIDQQVCMQPVPLRHLEDNKDMIWNGKYC